MTQRSCRRKNIDFLVFRNTDTTLQQPHLSQDTVDNILFSTVTVGSSSKSVLGPQSQTWKLRGCVFIVCIHSHRLSLFSLRECRHRNLINIQYNNSRYLGYLQPIVQMKAQTLILLRLNLPLVGTFTIFLCCRVSENTSKIQNIKHYETQEKFMNYSSDTKK